LFFIIVSSTAAPYSQAVEKHPSAALRSAFVIAWLSAPWPSSGKAAKPAYSPVRLIPRVFACLASGCFEQPEENYFFNNLLEFVMVSTFSSNPLLKFPTERLFHTSIFFNCKQDILVL
jgi:hypothetical protein